MFLSVRSELLKMKSSLPASGRGPLLCNLISASYSDILTLLNLLIPSKLKASSAYQHRSAHFL
jgi:hypothetical protein